jgi:glycosyltransferase involved in cell wall biosynthesis
MAVVSLGNAVARAGDGVSGGGDRGERPVIDPASLPLAAAARPPRAVAVVTRTRDRPLLLRRARASIASQTFRDLEWVVVNDGGEREPVEAEAAAARAAGLETLVIHREESTGMEAAANAGILATTSRYIAIHDDDDSWERPFLAATVAVLEKDPAFVGVITHSMQVVEQFVGDSIVTISRRRRNPHLRAVHMADLAITNLFPPISLLFRRQAYEAVGGFDEGFPVLGDWEFNLKLAMQGDIRVLPRPLANYHVRAGGALAPRYANSIVAERDLHHLQDAVFRNRLLRADMAAGRIGIGMLLAVARLQHRSHPAREPPLPPRQQRLFARAIAAAGRLLAPGRRRRS